MVPFEATVTELIGVLDQLRIRFLVGGSFASGAWGNPRQTKDMDIVVQMNP